MQAMQGLSKFISTQTQHSKTASVSVFSFIYFVGTLSNCENESQLNFFPISLRCCCFWSSVYYRYRIYLHRDQMIRFMSDFNLMSVDNHTAIQGYSEIQLNFVYSKSYLISFLFFSIRKSTEIVWNEKKKCEKYDVSVGWAHKSISHRYSKKIRTNRADFERERKTSSMRWNVVTIKSITSMYTQCNGSRASNFGCWIPFFVGLFLGRFWYVCVRTLCIHTVYNNRHKSICLQLYAPCVLFSFFFQSLSRSHCSIYLLRQNDCVYSILCAYTLSEKKETEQQLRLSYCAHTECTDCETNIIIFVEHW